MCLHSLLILITSTERSSYSVFENETKVLNLYFYNVAVCALKWILKTSGTVLARIISESKSQAITLSVDNDKSVDKFKKKVPFQ